MLVLGVESSCDETSVAIYDGNKMLSNVVLSQIDIHKEFGGVVPEVASRHHIEKVTYVLEGALQKAGLTLSDIDAVAVKQTEVFDAAVKFAKSEGKYIVSHVIPNPGIGVEKMAYRMDINKDKYNKKIPKSFRGLEVEAPAKKGSIGLLEVQGLVASIEGLDAMLKTSDVRLVHTEKRLGGRLVTIVITGSVSAVKSAVEAGNKNASELGEIFGCEVIANPHDEILKFFDMEV